MLQPIVCVECGNIIHPSEKAYIFSDGRRNCIGCLSLLGFRLGLGEDDVEILQMIEALSVEELEQIIEDEQYASAVLIERVQSRR